MSKLVFKAVAKLGAEPQEIYWLTGFRPNAVRNDWHVGLVLRGLKSGAFHWMPVPIGLLPILTLGTWFDHGELRREDARGEVGTVLIENVAASEVVTSAEIPEQLYVFPGQAGVQRLFRYATAEAEVLIPVVELVRYLFLHNRALANVVMRPGGLNLLFRPEVPGYQEQRLIQFTGEMPQQCLTRRFVKEFAWHALDPQARHAWDSIKAQTAGREYVMFSPPPIRDSVWQFRGLQHGRQWLILELLSLSGREVPCATLSYSHPRFRRIVQIPGDDSSPSGADDKSRNRNDRHRYVYELEEGEDGSSSDRNPQTMGLDSNAVDFENTVTLIKLSKETLRPNGGNHDKGGSNGGADAVGTCVVKVSAGERSDTAKSPPLEFQFLVPARPDTAGDLEAMAACVRCLRLCLPQAEIATALVQLKSGRVFSELGRDSRPAMVVAIRLPDSPPIVLLDVERTGVTALSVMALIFAPESVSITAVETAIKRTLDGLVDSGGHWNHEVENELSDVCQSRRLPRFLTPRNNNEKKPAGHWAQWLVDQLVT